MLERGKISSSMLACMMYLTILATSMVGAASMNYRLAGPNMWLTPYIGSFSALLLIIILVGLHRSFPGQSLIEYSPLLLGKWMGKAVGLLFLTISALQISHQARQFGELVNQYFFKETPLAVVIGSLFFVSVFAVRFGVEVIGRVAVLYMPLIVTIVLTFSLPFFKDMEVGRLLPFMENGVMPVIRGSVYVQLWMPMYAYITFFLPFVRDKQRVSKMLLISLSAISVTLSGMLALTVVVLDNATPLYGFPFMVLARYLTFFEFLEQFDSVVMFFWVVDVFVRTIVTFYGLTIGVAQWMSLPSYKAISVPLAVLVVALSFWGLPRVVDFTASGTHMTFVYIAAYFIIPLLLFLAAVARGKWKPAGASGSSSGSTEGSESSAQTKDAEGSPGATDSSDAEAPSPQPN
ncbi:GerAB/ArcD/ProY family transporter [Paenibacillus soyae]|uniref:Spore germination protein n=1 Tax=Paenibacillus soyae TaxID=2969249 RepID=A0A9X2MT85_9BACL|nr:spore germination protein [Paenibacillus soyae]MCR2805366.1 spore germination protein [Paenibacillus soyae]